VKWVVDVLNSAASEREDWETQDAARHAEDPEAGNAPNPLIRMSMIASITDLLSKLTLP
jgi:replication fork protection complex subunit Tof1/Swi1